MKGEEDPEKEALRYAKEIQQHLDLKRIKLFDWIFIGIGKDGHTASLFSGQHALDSTNFCESARHPETAQHRITMTPFAINNSARITYHVTGETKSEIISKLTTHTSTKKFPRIKNPRRIISRKKGCIKS
jgi:6-phosphogluconolactonase